MELVIKNNLETEIPQIIDFNFEQIKSELDTRLDRYRTMVVTEDAIKDAKADKANLNRLKTALEDKRKEVKKACLIPYEDFERKVKELVGMIDEPISIIDGQIKKFDDEKKEQKINAIVQFFSEEVGDLGLVLPFAKVYNPRWMNSTYNIADIEQEIRDAISKVSNDLAIIKGMGLDCEAQMLDVYLDTLDMSAAMSEKSRWEDRQRQLKAIEESRKLVAPVIDVPEDSIREAKEADKPAEVVRPAEEVKTIKVMFFNTTEAFRRDMKALTEKHNIRYGGIN